MGCNCGKPANPTGSKPKPSEGSGLSSKTQSFTLQLNNGATQSFSGSLLEARAAVVRAGGGSIKPR
jgi:hypothetical protein